MRVAIVFSGGPAPAANAVIAATASAFKRSGAEVFGLLDGYTHLLDRELAPRAPLVAGTHYRIISNQDLRGLRNSRGVLLGTARRNPGKEIERLDDLDDPTKSASLRALYDGLRELGVSALISIGGDGTLRTAYLFYQYQQRLTPVTPADTRIRVVHVPKTIDNDYDGIDFAFGFFTAVDVMAKELLNLRADALATRSYYVVSTMGRRAGWLAYGVAISGEAHMVIGLEDARGALRRADGKLDLDALADRIAELIIVREAGGKRYGVVVLAEGLSELLPDDVLGGASRNEYGHVSFSTLDMGRLLARRAAERYRERSGKPIKVTGVQLGYEARCAAPHAFDVVLGSQLGLGAYRALEEQQLDGVMVSASGQLELRYVPFSTLIDPGTLTAKTRFIERGSDFHRLAQHLGTRLPEPLGGE